MYSLKRLEDTTHVEQTLDYFYFAGRPVAQLSKFGGDTWTFLTTDHQGTPLLATDVSKNEIWRGPFEPFGRDVNQAAPSSARGQGIFLGFPGQWDDGRWQDASQGADLYYNVHRWYEFGTGRYGRADPLGVSGDFHPYSYALSNPVFFVDPTGEKARSCCTPVPGVPGPAKHCFIEYQDDQTGETTTYGLHRVGRLGGKGCKYKNDGFDRRNLAPKNSRTDCGPWSEDCSSKPCLDKEFDNYPNPSDYQLIRGPNSNSFARTLTTGCGLTPPSIAGERGQTPGWDKEGRPAKSRRFRCPEARGG